MALNWRKMGKIGLVIAVISSTAVSPVAGSPAHLIADWEVVTPNDGINKLAPAPQGGVYVAGRTGSYASVARYSADGTQIWHRTFGTFGGSVLGLAASDDGTVFVGNSYSDIAIYSHDGTLEGTAHGVTVTLIRGASVTSDGSHYVVGAGDPNYSTSYLTLFDPSGADVWTIQLDDDPDLETHVIGVAALPNGNAVVVSNIMSSSSSRTTRSTASVYAPSGELIWNSTSLWAILGPRSSYDNGEQSFSVVAYPDGGFVTFGKKERRTTNESPEGIVARFGPDFSPLWAREFGDPSLMERFMDGTVDDQGRIVATGYAQSYPTVYTDPTDTLLAAFSPRGALLWEATISEAAMDRGVSVAAGGDNHLYVASKYWEKYDGGGVGFGGSLLQRVSVDELNASVPRCEAVTLNPFIDLGQGDRVATDVSCIFGLGVTTGTSATRFSPDETVTREQMAAFLARMYRQISGSDCVETSPSNVAWGNSVSHVAIPFVDIDENSFAYQDVGCIYFHGITNGTSETTYEPAMVVTREQMASFLARLYRLLTGEACAGLPLVFNDISPTSFAEEDIACIYSLGITTGTSATQYSPYGSVTRSQMASFLARLYRAVI